MKNKILSVFVDESGRFQHPDAESRFYIVGFVFHDQNFSVTDLVNALDADWRDRGLAKFCFHAGPLIRGEKGYQFMMREQRTAIFARMMRFARQMEFTYHCLLVDKKFVSSSRQIVQRLRDQLSEFLSSPSLNADAFDAVKVYYDCGQAPVTNLLHDTFTAHLGNRVTFAQAVRPENYKLFQLADLVCSVKLVEAKLLAGDPMTVDESRFFRGPRVFKHDILRCLHRHEI
jgi:hypothetical protein